MFNLRKMLEGMGAQVNPFDGGKTYSSVNKKPAQKTPRGIPTIPRKPFESGEIARFNMQPAQGQYEDASLVQGPQGYHPMNADIANFRVPRTPENIQFEDGSSTQGYRLPDPVRMYEDKTFKRYPQGTQMGGLRSYNPALNYEDGTQGPRFKFYEDNSFTDYTKPDPAQNLRRQMGY